MTTQNNQKPDAQEEAEKPALGRRSFIGAAGTLAVTGAAFASIALESKAAAQAAPEPATTDEPADDDHHDTLHDLSVDEKFLRDTYRLRVENARRARNRGVPAHPNNGDDERYDNRIGSDTRGLPHNERGEVDLAAYDTLLHALETQDPADFEAVTLGGTRKLAGVLGTLALSTSGISSQQSTIPPAPALASAEKAAEVVESYWQSLLRDVPFWEYRSDTDNELVQAAAAEIDGLSGYTGPRDADGRVTPELLFRGTARYIDPADATGRTAKSIVPPGVTVGPYISQFILRDIPYGAQYIPGQLRLQLLGQDNDFLANYEEWLANQNGAAPTRTIAFDPVRRYLSHGRDLAEYAHGGAPSFWGASQLLGVAASKDPLIVGGLGAALSPTNPYSKITKVSSGSGAFNISYIQSFLPLSTTREIRVNYWAKWFVHRTPRPEALGGLVHQRLVNDVDYPIHEDALSSEAAARSFDKFGTYLISSAYPEGAPNHSSYPGGASSNAAVNATILKAFFDESWVIPNPVQPDPNDPTKLIPYEGEPLTVGGELNKLATNLGQGRNWAGIHWRSDAAASLPQAEEVAIALLRDERNTFREAFEGFSFTRFDGTTVTI
jgi:hypothetical protein